MAGQWSEPLAGGTKCGLDISGMASGLANGSTDQQGQVCKVSNMERK
jgi:hypothetical protein